MKNGQNNLLVKVFFFGIFALIFQACNSDSDEPIPSSEKTPVNNGNFVFALDCGSGSKSELAFGAHCTRLIFQNKLSELYTYFSDSIMFDSTQLVAGAKEAFRLHSDDGKSYPSLIDKHQKHPWYERTLYRYYDKNDSAVYLLQVYMEFETVGKTTRIGYLEFLKDEEMDDIDNDIYRVQHRLPEESPPPPPPPMPPSIK